jgi:hypothetical protein
VVIVVVPGAWVVAVPGAPVALLEARGTVSGVGAEGVGKVVGSRGSVVGIGAGLGAGSAGGTVGSVRPGVRHGAASRFEVLPRPTRPTHMSVAWSYPVTPLAAFALRSGFDRWDAIGGGESTSLSTGSSLT